MASVLQPPGPGPVNIQGLALGSEQQYVPKAEPHQLAHPELASFWHIGGRVLALSLLI